jgi:hypothetical protein
MNGTGTEQGMSARTAAAIEHTIIGIALLSLILIFQPFSLALYTVGCVLVVLGALAFNLVPLCEKGRPLRSLVMAGIIVIVLLFIVVGLSILSAWLYGVYFVQRP